MAAPAVVVMDDHRQSESYSAADLTGKPVPPREWLVPGLVPSRTNPVRSRLYLDQVADNPDARLLSTKKANYGRIGEEISMTWRAGIFVADSLSGPDSKLADNARAERVFLRLLDEFTKEGR